MARKQPKKPQKPQKPQSRAKPSRTPTLGDLSPKEADTVKGGGLKEYDLILGRGGAKPKR